MFPKTVGKPRLQIDMRPLYFLISFTFSCVKLWAPSLLWKRFLFKSLTALGGPQLIYIFLN